MQQSLLDINLNSLKNNALKKIIAACAVKSEFKIKNTNGFNLEYNGILLHNANSPYGEAKNIFENLSNQTNSIHIIYGIGLGYLFQYTAINSKGIVILYEPNIDILKTAFSLVDFSKELTKPNVYVAVTQRGLGDLLRRFMGFDNYPSINCLPSYKKIFKDQIENAQKQLNVMIGGIILDCSYTKNKFYPITCSVLNNIPYMLNEEPLCNIQNIYQDKPAVVVSAGPTLHENIGILKKYQNNVVIICVGPAYKALVNAGIKPDFLCVIETRNCAGQVKGIETNDVNIILEPYTHINFHKLPSKKTFLHISKNMPINKLWSDLSGANLKEYNSRGTVSYCALNSARILGCNPIILIGQDLGYIDKQLYSKDSVYGDLKLVFREEKNKYEVTVDDLEKYALALKPDSPDPLKIARRRIARYNETITTIKSITGEYIPTESVYATFALAITEFTKNHPGKKYINTSMKGAQLDGFENIPLETVLKNTTPINKSILPDNIINSSEKIAANLEKMKEQLNECLGPINTNKKLLSHFNMEYKRGRTLNKDMLLTLKKIIQNYTNLCVEADKKIHIFDFITKKEQMTFEAYLSSSENINIEAALKIAQLQMQFLDSAVENINEVNNIINDVIAELKIKESANEACTAKG